MADSVGQIGLDLVVNQNGFNKQMQGITGLAKKAGAALAAAFAVKKIIDFGKSAIDLGSDLNEVQNVVDVTFTSMSSKVNEFAKNAATSFGLSETMAKKYTGTFGAMAKAFGFSEKAAYDMSTTLTGLSGDVASFYNISQDEAYTKLKSVFTGETETLKDLGVVMTQAALDQYALANGYGKTTAKMSEAEKVALRYAFVQKQLTLASGDFARTSGGWANQVRVLTLQFQSFKATIGQGLINLFTPVIKVINILLGKLITLANAFKSFTELITGKKASDQTSNAISSIGDGAADAANNISGMGDAATKSAKKAKDAQKAFMGFDQVNVLPDNSNSDDGAGAGGSAGAGAGSAVDFGKLAEGDTVIDSTSSKFQGLIDKVKELGELFKQGFKIGLGDSDFSKITASIDSIKKSLAGIFTAPEVVAAADNWANAVALSLGKITGSAASIGITLATLITGSIAGYLDQNSGFIKDKIVSIFDASARAHEISGNLAVALAGIFTVFQSPAALQIGADLIAIFSNSFLSIIGLVTTFGADLIGAIAQPILDNQDKIKKALENTLGVIEDIVGGIKDFISNTFESINKAYDTYISPALDKLGSGFSKVFSAILDVYNKYLAPVLKELSTKFRELINGPIKELVDSIATFVGKLVDGVATIWDKTLSPLVAWVIKTLAPSFSKAVKEIGDGFLGLVSVVAKIASDILKALGGIIDFLVGVFTGNWKQAWTGIKEFFGGIIQGIKDLTTPIGEFFLSKFSAAYSNVKSAFSGIKAWFKDRYDDVTGVFTNIGTWFKTKFDTAYSAVKTAFSPFKDFFDGLGTSLQSTFKGAINSVISQFNKFIGWINSKLNFSWDGLKIAGKTIFDGGSVQLAKIPSIPPLAQGGYVKANTPQLALIGDNRHEGEVVAPESKLQQMALDVARLVGSGGGLTEAALYRVMSRVFQEYMHIYIGEEDLARHVNNGNQMIDLRNRPVKGGGY